MRTTRVKDTVLDTALVGSVVLLLVFFYVPIVTLVAFSFTSSRVLTLPIEGFSFAWYGELFRKPDFLPAVANSAIVAAVSTVFATVFGTAAAVAWIRYRFRLQSLFRAVTFAPLLFPQLLLGVVMLLWFSVLGSWLGFSTGLATVVIGHIVYITPFALVIVAVQVHGFDETLEDAARDAGASGWEVFREVTFPLLWPGIFSAATFSFLLSWGTSTFPIRLRDGTHASGLRLQRHRRRLLADLSGPRHPQLHTGSSPRRPRRIHAPPCAEAAGGCRGRQLIVQRHPS